MVDAITAPGMAIDIRLSTLEAVQQLGPKMANLLSGELARLRADSVLTQTFGMPAQVPAAHSDKLHAQQISVIGSAMIGLTAQTDMRAENASVTDRHAYERERESEHENDALSDAVDEPDNESKDQQSVDEFMEECESTAFVGALQQALIQFQTVALEAGYSGTPLAVILPAHNWLLAHAPADILQASKLAGDASKDLLILCLAFDGTLGRLGTVMGLVFRADRWIGSVRAYRVPDNEAQQECCLIEVAEPSAIVSAVVASTNADKTLEQVQGLRVRADDLSEELVSWSWQADQWSWY